MKSYFNQRRDPHILQDQESARRCWSDSDRDQPASEPVPARVLPLWERHSGYSHKCSNCDRWLSSCEHWLSLRTDKFQKS